MTHYSRRKTYWRDKCDVVYSKIIKLRDGKCQETNTKQGLQSAHIIGRNYYATRWDFDNAIALNFKRHKYYTHHLVEWRKFIKEKFGEGYYEMLEERALKYKKRSLVWYRELYHDLAALLTDLKESQGRVSLSTNPGRTRGAD